MIKVHIVENGFLLDDFISDHIPPVGSTVQTNNTPYVVVTQEYVIRHSSISHVVCHVKPETKRKR